MADTGSAADAVAMAAWNEKKWVWVPDAQSGYLLGSISDAKEAPKGSVVVDLLDGGERVVSLDDTQKVNPPKFDKMEDMADLGYLNEASVTNNLNMRYLSNLIYTYSGLFLVAVNPYRSLPLYTPSVVESYRDKRRNAVPPHIYAITDAAYRQLLGCRENQSILITGESGAGKTENTKKVIQYLAAIACRGQGSTEVETTDDSLEKQILQANPILEAFGNAQTVRNNNSSRFGKFIRIEFNHGGIITGANIERYLLEKSRVTGRSPQERNYHVFYQLLSGADPELRQQLLLEKTSFKDFAYLKDSNATIDGVDDSDEFKLLKEAMKTMKFDDVLQNQIFCVIAVLLHIGNIKLKADREDWAQVDDPTECQKVCHLLGINVDQFQKDLLKPRIKAGRDWVVQSRTVTQVHHSLEALSRSIYERLFGMIVEKVNLAVDRPGARNAFIGVLDIAGFEIFEHNGFEQLCINYTNERLQQFFNHHMFVMEQEEYKRENIEWTFIDFGLDLQEAIDLIEKTNPVGILSCLDEECVMPKATDLTFTNKLHSLWKSKSPKYAVPRFAKEGFSIQHYAGKVDYTTTGWLERNKDPLNECVTRLLASSLQPLIAHLFKEDGIGANDPKHGGGGATRTMKKGAFRTVAQKHKEQLTSLMKQLNSTQPHFVRCILPNSEKRPGRLETLLVLEQLRCNGVLEGIRICRAGFPNKVVFAEFRHRYELLCPGVIPAGFLDGRKASKLIIDAVQLDDDRYKLGTSKVFFRAGVLAELEEKREVQLSKMVSVAQACVAGFLCRQKFRKRLDQVKAVRILQRNARVYISMYEWPWWKLYTKVKPLLNVARTEDELRRKDSAIQDLTEANEEKQKRLAKMEKDLSQKQLEIRKVEESLESERSAAADQAEILRRTQENRAVLEEELGNVTQLNEQLESNLSNLQSEKKEAEEKLTATAQDLEEKSTRVSQLEREKAAKEEHVKELNAEGERLQNLIQSLEANINEVRKEKEEYGQKLNDMEVHQRQTEGQKSQLDERLKNIEEQRAEAEQKVSKLAEQKSALEGEVRSSKMQIEELQSSKQELEGMLKKRVDQLEQLNKKLAEEEETRKKYEAQSRELHAQINALQMEVSTEKGKAEKLERQKKKLEAELAEVWKVMEEKEDSEGKEAKMRRMKEEEVQKLVSQTQALEAELAQKTSSYECATIEHRKKMDDMEFQLSDIKRVRDVLNTRADELQKELEEVQEKLRDTEKTKRLTDLELKESIAKQEELIDQLADLKQNLNNLEKDRAASQAKASDSEALISRLEREKTSFQKQLQMIQSNLDEEGHRRHGLEQAKKRLHEQLSDLTERLGEEEAKVSECQRKLNSKQQELEAWKEKYERDIAERVNETETAKKKVEREVDELAAKVHERDSRIQTLDKLNTRLTAETEDLQLEIDREHANARRLERTIKTLEAELQQASANFESERMQKDALESTNRNLNATIQSLKATAEDHDRQLAAMNRKKLDAENELQNLVSEIGEGGKNMHDIEKAKKRLEIQVEELQAENHSLLDQIHDVQDSRRQIEEELQTLTLRVENEMALEKERNDETRKALLKEVNSLGDQLEYEALAKQDLLKAKKKLENDLSDLLNKEDDSSRSRSEAERAKKKSESALKELQGKLDSAARSAKNWEESNQRMERKSASLQARNEDLEAQLETTDRAKRQAERKVTELTEQLQNGEEGMSKSHLFDLYKKAEADLKRLQEDNQAQADQIAMLEQRSIEHANMAQNASLEVQSLQAAELARVEEQQKALQTKIRIQQREIDEQAQEIAKLAAARNDAVAEAQQTAAKLEDESRSRQAEAAEKRALGAQIRDLESKLKAEATKNDETNKFLDIFKEKYDKAAQSLEDSETARMKVEQSESAARMQLRDSEETIVDLQSKHSSAMERLNVALAQISEHKINVDSLETENEELCIAKSRLVSELESERASRRSAADEYEEELESSRKRHSAQIKTLMADLESERRDNQNSKDLHLRAKEEGATMRVQRDQMKEKAETALRDKQKLEEKLKTLAGHRTNATRQLESQNARNVQLMNQNIQLRSAIDDLETKNSGLERQKQSAETRLADLVDQNESLQTKAANLEKAYEEVQAAHADVLQQIDEMENSRSKEGGRMSDNDKALEAKEQELQQERQLREAIEKSKTAIESQYKEMALKVVELESRMQNETSSRATARLQSRLDELAKLLQKEGNDREEATRACKRLERKLREVNMKLSEKDNSNRALSGEIDKLTKKLDVWKGRADELELSREEWQRKARKWEREADEARTEARRIAIDLKTWSVDATLDDEPQLFDGQVEADVPIVQAAS